MQRYRYRLAIPISFLFLFVAACNKTKPIARNQTPPAPAAVAPSRATTPVSAARTTPASTSRTPTSSQAQRPGTPDQATRDRIDTLLARISDAYFDYNQHSLRPDAIQTLEQDSAELRNIITQYPSYKLVIEGHADERGSEEYNLGLGDARALAAENYLLKVGIPATQLSIVSYGKDRPVCTEHDEACWQKNRRIHIVAKAS